MEAVECRAAAIHRLPDIDRIQDIGCMVLWRGTEREHGTYYLPNWLFLSDVDFVQRFLNRAQIIAKVRLFCFDLGIRERVIILLYLLLLVNTQAALKMFI